MIPRASACKADHLHLKVRALKLMAVSYPLDDRKAYHPEPIRTAVSACLEGREGVEPSRERSHRPSPRRLASNPKLSGFVRLVPEDLDSRFYCGVRHPRVEPATGVKPAKKAIQRASVFETAGENYRMLERFSISRTYSNPVLTPLRLQPDRSWVLQRVTAHQTGSYKSAQHIPTKPLYHKNKNVQHLFLWSHQKESNLCLRYTRPSF